jgi:hypothetical protein
MVQGARSSISVKQMTDCPDSVFTDVGPFHSGSKNQEAYVHHYLALSNNVSDQSLMKHICYWLSGWSIYYPAVQLVADAQILGTIAPPA